MLLVFCFCGSFGVLAGAAGCASEESTPVAEDEDFTSAEATLMTFTFDGELVTMRGALTYRVLPEALEVFAPPPEPEPDGTATGSPPGLQ